MNSEFTRDVSFYLPIGTPNGTDIFMTNGLTIEPRLISVTPSVGSPAGSIIIAQVKGVGPNSIGVNLKDTTGQDVCQSVIIYKSGEIQCKTKARNVTNGELKVSQGSKIYTGCA
jgi:hypothetical protein